MSGVAVALGVGLSVLVGVWLVGSIALRVVGVLVVAASLLGLLQGEPVALAWGLAGFVIWLVGHWLYALKHHVFRSALARRVFAQALPRRLDPTRTWTVRSQPGP